MRFTYPVNLLLENKRCLIVGGGKVAARKLAALVGKAASITVVAPEICEKICELAVSTNGIILREQEFAAADLDEIFLAFAATSDKAVNRHISELCAARGVLCCVVDENWKAGSFITPASFSADGITVAVSTSGVSCRRTRLIKDNLAHHVGLAERAELLIIGTDHRFLDVKQRELLHLSPEKNSELGGMLKQLWGVHEFMLINTCNRLELAAIVCPSPGLERLIRLVMGFDAITEEQFYCKHGETAFAHLAKTAAGLFSQLTGEKHIAAQVKMALAESKNNSWCGSLMQDWLDSALCLAKAIRGILEPHFGSMDIEEVTNAYLEDLFPDLPERRIVVAGTGTVGGNLVKLLAPRCRELVWLYHRRKPEIDLAMTGKIELFQLEHLEQQMT
ncbi:MAG: NAD(P)-dependent oxidoreductase, partial [Victivallaceae bacterium]